MQNVKATKVLLFDTIRPRIPPDDLMDRYSRICRLQKGVNFSYVAGQPAEFGLLIFLYTFPHLNIHVPIVRKTFLLSPARSTEFTWDATQKALSGRLCEVKESKESQFNCK